MVGAFGCPPLPPQAPPLTHRSVHRWCHNGRSILADAIVTATNIRPSSAISRTAVSRKGNGSITLTGPYTGDADTTVDVEITNGNGAPLVSAPVFKGVGKGEIEDLEALPGATAQTYTVELIDLGTETRTAETDLEGVTLRAKVEGDAGNAISLDVDTGGLTYTATDFSLLEPLEQGTSEATGPGWDWGQPIGTADQVPADALRLVIGDDRSVVYTSWRYYQDGEWHYRYLPDLRRTYKAGERIYRVDGSRTCTLSDGVTPEVYGGVVTLYDLLTQIQGSSALVDVIGVPSDVRSPDNLAAVVDLRTRTEARVDWTTGEGSDHARGFTGHFAGAAAATELITARCYANNRQTGASLGAERWELEGSVSGYLGRITTGAPYLHPAGLFGMTIPTRLPDGYGDDSGEIAGRYVPATRQDGDPPVPDVCFEALRLGPGATDKVIEFEYKQRPAGDCDCENSPWDRLPGADRCLTIDETGEIDLSTLDAGLAASVEQVQYAYKGWVGSNTEITADGEVRTAIHDLQLFERTRNILLDCASKLHNLGRSAWDGWAAGTAVSTDYVITPGNGYKYRVTTPGTTHASTEPTWPTTVGQTVNDNGVIWTCVSKTPDLEFADLLAEIETDMGNLGTLGGAVPAIKAFTTGTVVAVGDYVAPGVTPNDETSYTGHVYKVLSGAGTLSSFVSDEQGWPTDGNVFHTTDTTLGVTFVLQDQGPLSEWASDDINWMQDRPGEQGISRQVDDFVERYASLAQFVLAVAEVPPDFSDASIAGSSRCWRDTGDAYWWVPRDSGYLPLFTNQEYVSVRHGAGGEIVPTHEWAGVVKVNPGCVGNLKEGDVIRISLGNAGWPSTYQVGDRLIMALVAAAPLQLAGGQDGDDTLTWRVDRSVDGPGSPYNQASDPDLYDDGQIRFRLQRGGIPPELGDTWFWCVESGTFKYRRDAGAWSADTAIGQTAIGDGLQLDFQPGACPSYVDGDTAAFEVQQPYKVSGALTPDDWPLAWTGDGTTIRITATGKSMDCLLLGLHTLPAGALIHVLGNGLDRYLPWRAGTIAMLLDAPIQDPDLTLTITGAPDAEIRWLWAGQTVESHVDADTQARTRQHLVQPGGGLNPTHLHLGAGWGLAMNWEGHFTDDNARDFVVMLDHVVEAGGQPVCLIPHADLPSETFLVTLGRAMELPDVFEYQDSVPGDRMHRLSLEVLPYYE